jgi:ELWxxDGT repeat protein
MRFLDISSLTSFLLAAMVGCGSSNGDAPNGDAGVGEEGGADAGGDASAQPSLTGYEVFDVNKRIDGDVKELAVYRGKTYFAATDVEHGRELWVSDGTDAGTKLAVDLIDGPSSSSPRGFVVVSDRLYFVAADDAGLSLYESDATKAGTRRIGLADEDRNASASVFGVGDRVCVSDSVCTDTAKNALDPALSIEAYGVVEGTTKFAFGELLNDLVSIDKKTYATTELPVSFPRLQRSVVLDDRLIFVGSLDSSGGVIVSDGTTAGTTRLAGVPASADKEPSDDGAVEMSTVGAVIGFEDKVYRLAGAAATAVELAGLPPSTLLGVVGSRAILFSAPSRYYAYDLASSTTEELPALPEGRPHFFARTSNRLVFLTADVDRNPSLVVTDGTAANTVKLGTPSELAGREIVLGTRYLEDLLVHVVGDDAVVFRCESDRTFPGPCQLRPLSKKLETPAVTPVTAPSAPGSFHLVQGGAIFEANALDSTHPPQTFFTDGTVANTFSISSTPRISAPAVVAGRTYFVRKHSNESLDFDCELASFGSDPHAVTAQPIDDGFCPTPVGSDPLVPLGDGLLYRVSSNARFLRPGEASRQFVVNVITQETLWPSTANGVLIASSNGMAPQLPDGAGRAARRREGRGGRAARRHRLLLERQHLRDRRHRSRHEDDRASHGRDQDRPRSREPRLCDHLARARAHRRNGRHHRRQAKARRARRLRRWRRVRGERARTNRRRRRAGGLGQGEGVAPGGVRRTPLLPGPCHRRCAGAALGHRRDAGVDTRAREDRRPHQRTGALPPRHARRAHVLVAHDAAIRHGAHPIRRPLSASLAFRRSKDPL